MCSRCMQSGYVLASFMTTSIKISPLLFQWVWVAIALVAGAARGENVYVDFSSQPSGLIYFNSVTPKSKWQLVQRKYDTKPTLVSGVLSVPAGSTGRTPAMIIAHGSGGVSPTLFGRWQRFFNGMGIATFVVDSFTGRGITSTIDDQSQINLAAHEADVLAALRLLATDPRIDPHRIGLIGFSRGGSVALEMTMESFRKGIIDDDLKFAALIGFYPGCSQVWWERPRPLLTNTALMLALAEKDDYTPARKCEQFVPIMQQDGQSVEVHVYPDAYHDFDNQQQYFKYHPNGTTTRNCPSVMMDVKHDAYYRLPGGERFANVKELSEELSRCTERGVSTGSNPSQASKAEQDVRRFVRVQFHLD